MRTQLASQPVLTHSPDTPAFLLGRAGAIPTPMACLAGHSARAAESALAYANARRQEIQTHVDALRDSGSDAGRSLGALAGLRFLLAAETEEALQDFLDLGGLPALRKQLDPNFISHPTVHHDAVWALGNIAASRHAEAIVPTGIVLDLFTLLQSESIHDRPDLCEQCLWVIGNLAADDDVKLREYLLQHDVTGLLSDLFNNLASFDWNHQSRSEVLCTMTWLMSSLCRGCSPTSYPKVVCMLDFFAQVLTGDAPDLVSLQALQAICDILDTAPSQEERAKRLQQMLQVGFVTPDEVPRPPAQHPLMIAILACLRRQPVQQAEDMDREAEASDLALCIVGNIMLSNTAIVDAAIAAGAIEELYAILADARALPARRRKAAWALANIAAGSAEQAMQLMEQPGFWPTLRSLMLYQGALAEGEAGITAILDLRCECAWAVANLARSGAHVRSRLDAAETIRLLVAALTCQADADLLRALLQSVDAMLSGSAEQPSKSMVAAPAALGLLEVLSVVQQSSDSDVANTAGHLIAKWGKAVSQESGAAEVCVSAMNGGPPSRPAAYRGA